MRKAGSPCDSDLGTQRRGCPAVLGEEGALVLCSTNSLLLFLLSAWCYWHTLKLDLHFIALKQKSRSLYHFLTI